MLTNAATCSRPGATELLLMLGLTCAAPATVLTQEPHPSTPSRFCLRPDPATGCDWFPITEFGLAVFRPDYQGPTRFWNLGIARTIGDQLALGGTVIVTSADDFETTVTLAPTGRINLSRSLALNIAPGVVISGSQWRDLPQEQPTPDVVINTRAVGDAPAFAVDLSLTFRDWAALFLYSSVFTYSHVQRQTLTLTDLPGGGTSWESQMDVVAQEGVITSHWIGIRAGSYPGLALGALAVIVTAIVRGSIEN